jgi:acetyl esterase/lipase
MLRLPKPQALLADWLVWSMMSRASRPVALLPDAPPDAQAFWAAQQVSDGPVPDLAASLRVLETSDAGTVSQFAFPSRVVSPLTENNTVPGRYYVPTQQQAGKDAPFVLLLHASGVRDSAFETWHAQRLMARGCRVAHIALPYQLERRPQQVDASVARTFSDVSHTLAMLGQAVCDAADVLRWARAERAGRVMVAGWSMGGLVAALVATQIPLDGALLVEPAANLAWMRFHRGLLLGSMQRRWRRAGISQEKLERWFAPALPANLRPQVPQAGLRMLAARYDFLVGYKPVLALWHAWGQPALNVQPTGHVNLLFSPALVQELDTLVGC